MIFGHHLEPESLHDQPLEHVFAASLGSLESLTWTSQDIPGDVPISIGITYMPTPLAPTVKIPEPPAFDSSLPSPPGRGDQEDFYGFADEDWFYSSASLEGLKALQLCIACNREDEHTVGMMLFFEDDRRECLGQCRPDCTVSQRYDLPCLPLVYRYHYSNDRTPSVKIVVQQSNVSWQALLDDGFIDLPLHGKWIWWSSVYGNVLDHLVG